MSGVGVWFEGWIEPFLDLLRLEGIGPFLALVIVFFAIFIGLAATWWFYTYYKELSGALKVLEDIDGPDSFWGRYEKIAKYFLRRPGRGLSSCWREFSETLIFPGEERQTVQNMARPREFFDADEAGFTTPFLRIWPNIFVGIGLVLTFAGLIAALATAVKGMEGSPEEAQSAVLGLLLITSAKFYTSLMALGSSIILSMLFRFYESRRDGLFAKLADKLELGLDFVSLEAITLEQLKSTRSQTKVLEQFNNDLAAALGKHIEDAVSNAMSPVVEELTAMGKNMGQNNIEAMKEIGDAVAQNVQGAAGESISHLSDRLDEITAALGDMPQNLKESTSEFSSKISATITKLAEATDASTSKVGSAMDQAGEEAKSKIEEAGSSVANEFNETGKVMKEALEGSISELAGSMTTFGSNLGAAEKTIGKLNSTLAKASDTIGEASSGIDGSVKSLRDGAEGINDLLELALRATDNIRTAVEQMNDGTAKSASELKGVLQRLEDEMRSNGEMWEAHSKQFDGVNEKLGEIFSRVNEQIEKSLGRMSDFVVKIDDSFRGAIISLQEAVEDFSEARKEPDEEPEAGK